MIEKYFKYFHFSLLSHLYHISELINYAKTRWVCPLSQKLKKKYSTDLFTALNQLVDDDKVVK